MSNAGEHEQRDHRDGDRVKTAREILEERLARSKSDAPRAEEALKAAADHAPSGADAPGSSAGASASPLEKERDEWKNEALRARADLDNYQKRVRREMQETRDFAAAGVLGDLIAALDNLDLTIQAAKQTPDVTTIVTGAEMVREQLEKILKDRGAERIPATNVPFDPRKHEAVLLEERADVPDGFATQELRRGYQLKDRVLRASQVKVNRAPK
jgi:molecular chaperone GrpE